MSNNAAPVILSADDKLRLVLRLLFHQGNTINYNGFDPQTGQSKIAIQRLIERLRNQVGTDAPATSLAAPATPSKKRGRAAKDASPNEPEEKPSARKRAKKAIKEESKEATEQADSNEN